MKASLKSTLGAAIFGLAALTAGTPASAEGSVTMMITPRGDAAEAIAQHLAIYSLVEQFSHRKKKRNKARISQKGRNNAAAVTQQGLGNHGLVVQRGRDHTATLGQYGSNNALGVFQLGKNTNLDFVQTGNGQAAFVIQGGW